MVTGLQVQFSLERPLSKHPLLLTETRQSATSAEHNCNTKSPPVSGRQAHKEGRRGRPSSMCPGRIQTVEAGPEAALAVAAPLDYVMRGLHQKAAVAATAAVCCLSRDSIWPCSSSCAT
jgi:hypothetical protein